MHASLVRGSKLQLAALSGAIALALVAGSAQAQISQSGERKNINRVGAHRSAGSPLLSAERHPVSRRALDIVRGPAQHHSGARGGLSGGTLPNPLNGNACEANGTMIIDVTDPANPVEKFHIPATPGGQSTMVRMCLGSVLPGGNAGQGLYAAQCSGRCRLRV